MSYKYVLLIKNPKTQQVKTSMGLPSAEDCQRQIEWLSQTNADMELDYVWMTQEDAEKLLPGFRPQFIYGSSRKTWIHRFFFL